ncbi:hypothetical protein [Litorilituus sediminis]|uniref:DUF3718 domain-containing protein n=1 Tax=Litorilituus sediminis TaxID=718192 RepID=A0A4P6P3L4_9GAMM|nr:hypothetical protein [Litorilituus sediminis]QBG36126.1 hypothetical protein EMK97_10585 [Litorilituus sediminis]
MLKITRTVTMLALFICLNSYAENTNVLKIYNQFTAVSAAAGKCMTPSKEDLTAFLANYQMVTTLMYQEVRKRKPNFTEQQAKSAIKIGSDKVTKAVYKVIESESCDSPKIQDLIKRFSVQAKWQPSS